MTETLAETPVDMPVDAPQVAAATEETPAAAPARKPAGGAARIQGSMPTLEKLAQLYPALFGAVFLPLKRGIFQELLSAHPEQFERDALKAALSVHTRSTRYLNAVASGLARHDLQGAAVEPMAPEHVYQSLLEVFRRRQAKAGEDLSAKLRQRIAQAFVASGLSRDAYTELVQSKDEAANATLEQAMADAAESDAKAEATRRAFEASGQTVEAFADMYGLHPKAVADALSRATRWTQA
ncbi:MAG: prop effector [Burkholderiales bacterium PBB3]|nr:MAG: prop effector [Burkholderiales bacterium PBB3]